MDHSFVNRELSLFSYEILGLVGPDGASAHDLFRMAQHGRILDWAGESQYYVEPKRLAKLGYLTARAEPGKTRPRTVYTLTDKGLEALSAWARTAVRFTPVKSELLLRLLIADLVGEEATRASITTIRDDIGDLFVRLTESEAFARTRPSRTKYLLLVFGFLRRLLDLHLEFVDELERELAPGSEPASGSEALSVTAAVASARQHEPGEGVRPQRDPARRDAVRAQYRRTCRAKPVRHGGEKPRPRETAPAWPGRSPATTPMWHRCCPGHGNVTLRCLRRAARRSWSPAHVRRGESNEARPHTPEQ